MFAKNRKNRKYARGASLGEGMVRELIDEMLREAMAEQARDLEKHLVNIHERLVRLEKKK